MLKLQLIIIFYCSLVIKAQNNCVALTNSTVCPAFSEFYIGLSGLSQDFAFLNNVTTIEEFDQSLIDYVNSTSAYLLPLGCLSTNFNRIIPYARYSLTRLCAGMIQNSHSLPCNFNRDLTPPPLCKSTCFEWIDSIAFITSNPKVCTDSTQKNNTLTSYHEQCETWQGYNGTINDSCISGTANEPYFCGFGDNINLACYYCEKNPTDDCCLYVKCKSSSLSTGTIIGIAIGSAAFIILILLFVFYLYNRKYKNRTITQILRLSSTTNSSDSNISKEKSNMAIPPFKNNNSSDPITALPKLVINTNSLLIPPSSNPESITPNDDEFFVVVYPYVPQMADELLLNIGDILCVAVQFNDGWALGFNITTGLKGAFPIVCISPAPKESVDRLLNSTNDIQPIHSNSSIPHRSNSLKSFDYSDAESPQTPTVYTPFFINNET